MYSHKALATIETEIGTMTIYFNGIGEEMTAEHGDHVEEIGCTISEAVQAYNEKRSYKVETISHSVSDRFMKHGAKVEPCGIGWKIIF